MDCILVRLECILVYARNTVLSKVALTERLKVKLQNIVRNFVLSRAHAVSPLQFWANTQFVEGVKDEENTSPARAQGGCTVILYPLCSLLRNKTILFWKVSSTNKKNKLS